MPRCFGPSHPNVFLNQILPGQFFLFNNNTDRSQCHKVIILSHNNTKWSSVSVDPLLKNTDTGLKAMILMGGTLPQEKALKDFPVPVLTLAAELDGITRITRMAEEYEKLTDDKLWAFFLGLYETPVIYIDGASHGQFASGKMPPYITNGDLEPKETVDVVHTMIGQHVSDFLTANFGSDETEIDAALGDLSFAFFKSMKKFQPFLDVRDLETDEEESLWTVLAQEYFAGEYSDQVGIYNEVLGNPGFFMKEPSVSVTDGKAIVGTASLIDNVEKSNVIHVHSPRESPYEINMKLVSKESIAKALGKTDSSLKSEPNTCKTLNQLALVVALTLSDADAHERYLERGRPIIFEEDNVPWANFLWAPTPLEMWEEKDGLHVRSVAMVTHTSSWRNPGVHYCKVLPPYRAMEWVNVDSLRPFRG